MGFHSLYSIQQTPVYTYYVPGTQGGPKRGPVSTPSKLWTLGWGRVPQTHSATAWPHLYSEIIMGTTLMSRMTGQCITTGDSAWLRGSYQKCQLTIKKHLPGTSCQAVLCMP